MDTWSDVGHTSNLNEVRTKRRKMVIFGKNRQREREKREREEGERRKRL